MVEGVVCELRVITFRDYAADGAPGAAPAVRRERPASHVARASLRHTTRSSVVMTPSTATTIRPEATRPTTSAG